jgi:hypothetical protein
MAVRAMDQIGESRDSMSTPGARHSHKRARPRRRNQLLGIGLAVIAALIFATAVGITVSVREAEGGHVIAGK